MFGAALSSANLDKLDLWKFCANKAKKVFGVNLKLTKLNKFSAPPDRLKWFSESFYGLVVAVSMQKTSSTKCEHRPRLFIDIGSVKLINSIFVRSKNNKGRKSNYLSFPSASRATTTATCPQCWWKLGFLVFSAMFSLCFFPSTLRLCNLAVGGKRRERKWQNLVITIGNKSFMFNVGTSTGAAIFFSFRSCDLPSGGRQAARALLLTI